MAGERAEVIGRIDLALADPNDATSIAAAVALGNQAKRTLGLLPSGAYADAAARRGLLLARDAGTVIGYALFAITSSRIRLTHLCVADAYRRRGLARQMVEWISSVHRDRPGILAWCRHDYGLGRMWSNLGFERRGERPARAGEGLKLVAWWRDHGHPALFARSPDSVLVRAAIDLNILRDLADWTRTDSAETRALTSDQLSDRLELVRTPSLDREIDGIEGELRENCVREAARLPACRGDRNRIADIRLELLTAAQANDPSFPREPQDSPDLEHLAEAIGADLNVFITRDVRLARLLAGAAERHGVQILRPAEVVIRLDELVHAEAYRPAALLETAFTRRRIPAGHENEVLGLLEQGGGERRTQLQKRLRDLATRNLAREGIYAPDGQLVAAWAMSRSEHVLDVPLLRVAAGGLADTLARQILFILRQQARADGLTVIRVSDPLPPRTVVLALLNDAFLPAPGGPVALVLDVCGPAAEVEHAAVIAARAAGIPEPVSLSRSRPAAAAAEVERAWWPAKVLDGTLPTYLVPIRPAFSRDLLGVPRGLFLRENGLGLSREHVYYRAPTGLRLAAPARILWYITSGGQPDIDDRRVIACSYLDDVIEGASEELHSRFRHLGVWSLDQVQRSARGGAVQALRFTNTELLPTPISLRRVRQIATTLRQPLVLRAPSLLSPDLFAALYREGRQRA